MNNRNENINEWVSNINEDHKTQAFEYYRRYKERVLNELFEIDLPNINKISPVEYIVSNGDDITAKYTFKQEKHLNGKEWSIHWEFEEDNENITSTAWKRVVATAFKVIYEFIKNKNPDEILISGDDDKTEIYKSDSFVSKLKTILNNSYSVVVNDDDILITKMEITKAPSIKKTMEIQKESYSNASYTVKNGNINAVSKIYRWNSIKKKIERETLKEILNIK